MLADILARTVYVMAVAADGTPLGETRDIGENIYVALDRPGVCSRLVFVAADGKRIMTVDPMVHARGPGETVAIRITDLSLSPA